MLIFTFLCLLTSITLFVYKKTKSETRKTDLKIDNLNGNVKSITWFKFEMTEKFGEKVEENVSEMSFVSYNEDGNILQAEYNSDAEMGYSFEKNKYDDEGNKIECAKYYILDPEIKYSLREGDKFDKIEGWLINLTKYKYDDEDNNVESATYNKEGELKTLIKNKFDEEGNNVESATHNKEGELTTLIKNKFDNSGNLIEIKSDFISNKYKVKNEINYLLFDDKNNWIRQSQNLTLPGLIIGGKDLSNNLIYYKREIEYYE